MTNVSILSTKDLIETFTKIQKDNNFGFLQIGIDFDANSFQLIKSENKKANENETWKAMQALIDDKNHTYFIIRDPIDSDLYILIHFASDSAPIKQRLLYASSRGTLKGQLGNSNFNNDYYVSKKEECNAKTFKEQRDLQRKIDFRSEIEIEREIDNFNTGPMSVRGQIMIASFPIEMTESGVKAIQSYKSKQVKCIFLSLTGGNQSVQGEEQKGQNIDEIKEAIPENEPRYILFFYSKSTEKNSEPKPVFAYYCPDKADRKLKFTYSTCKANILDYCAQQRIDFFAKIEIGEISEISSDFLDYHVFPEKIEKQPSFNMPKPPSKRRHKRKKKVVA